MMMKNLVSKVVPAALIALSVLAVQAPAAFAERTKVDCDAVMQAANGGKTKKEIAADMKISLSSVRRCEKAAAKTAAAASSSAASPAAAASAKP
jgi:DNA-binding NarL/FixJ family response regulator